MHILHIVSWYSTPDNPQRGSFFREQALALQKAGHQCALMVSPARIMTWQGLRELRDNWHLPNEPALLEDDDKLLTYRIPWWGVRPSISFREREALALRVFDSYVEEHGQPDLLHGHSALYGGYLAGHIGAARGLPVVLTEHATFILRDTLLSRQRAAVMSALQQADACLAVGHALAQALQRYSPRCEIAVIGNSIDTTFFTLTNPPPAPPLVFAAVGNLYRHKRFDLLLHAFAVFRGQDIVLRIGGDGRERRHLEALSRTLGLDAQVTFLGRLTREAVRDLIQQSHVVVSSSDVETFGLTLAEAMACGRPVVATQSGGPEGFIDDSSGLLVPTGDAQKLSEALQTVRDRYADYEPVAIRARIVDRFGEHAFVERLEAVYRSVLAGA